MSPLLAAAAGLLAFTAAWELAGMGRAPALDRTLALLRVGSHAARASALAPAVERRLRRAGLAERVGHRAYLAARLGGVAAGGAIALLVVPVTPGRLVPVVAAGLVVAGFLAPDAWVERAGRRRSTAILAALPDALDLLAVGVGAGRPPAAMLGEIAQRSAGPLATELALVDAELQAGASQERALRALRERLEIPAVRALVATLERSRRYGSPLADQLHALAAAMRTEERRRIGERAVRAAPKIQLAIALLLVPSALLAIAAALVAHADTLFQALR